MNGLVGGAFIGFLSTPSARRATIAPPLRRRGVMISIHALREEGDRVAAAQFFFDFLFLSTPSARRATCCRRHRTGRRCISIHALREEGDYASRSLSLSVILFLSTPSARRATSSRKQAAWFRNYFYPRPPRGGRPPLWRSLRASAKISIHALREEGDGITAVDFRGIAKFLSTPSARRATTNSCGLTAFLAISIHALREEGDLPPAWQSPTHPHFYPRPPRGGRPRTHENLLFHRNFYPRPPRGGRPAHGSGRETRTEFLSTPSARRATVTSQVPVFSGREFLSTPSARRATLETGANALAKGISIHALREEGDRQTCRPWAVS